MFADWVSYPKVTSIPGCTFCRTGSHTWTNLSSATYLFFCYVPECHHSQYVVLIIKLYLSISYTAMITWQEQNRTVNPSPSPKPISSNYILPMVLPHSRVLKLIWLEKLFSIVCCLYIFWRLAVTTNIHYTRVSNLFDPRPPCLNTEDPATPRTNLYHDHDDYFAIWLIISGIL